MTFNSLRFIIFFPVVFMLYYSLPHKWRWVLLLIASYYFYMCWKAEYALLIMFATVVDYYVGLAMENTSDKQKKKKYLLISLISQFGILFGFKYFNFLNESTRVVFEHFNLFYDIPYFNVLLPVGISFYTFQSLSYTIDVYQGDCKAEHNLGRFALYVIFFPQLVAGPIERSTRLLPQFQPSNEIFFNRENVVSGLRLMLWGFFKKVVIADRLGIYTGLIFNNPEHYSGLHVIIASFFMHVQVYADLSAYTDIARGSARTLGIDIMRNFNYPLFSRSIFNFWKRWHISLTTWFRDYLYIPLGGNRVKISRWYLNIFLVFFISGIWHGANWTYVIWGILHGIYQLIEIWTDKFRKLIFRITRLDKIPLLLKTLSVITVMLMISFATLFFGAKNLHDSMTLINNFFTGFDVYSFIKDLSSDISLKLSFILIILLFIIEYVHTKHNLFAYIIKKPVAFRWAVYLFIAFLISNFGVFDEKPFIYFAF